MSYDAYEDSIEDGQPVFLYRFTLDTNVWRYTSADTDIEAAGQLWKAVPISDDGVSQTGQSAADALTITASADIAPARIYMEYPPAQPIGVDIFSKHEGSEEVHAFYVGEIAQVNTPVPGTASIVCETISASMDRSGLRLGWQRACPYALYDPKTCTVNKALHAHPAIVGTIVDNMVMFAAMAGQPVNKFAGGFLEWTTVERGMERRAIETNDDAGAFRMFGTADGLQPGMAVVIYPGCQRTTLACQGFNNLLNYGGEPGMQGWSPFDGNPVFY